MLYQVVVVPGKIYPGKVSNGPMGVCSIQGVSHPQLAISLHTTLEAGSPKVMFQSDPPQAGQPRDDWKPRHVRPAVFFMSAPLSLDMCHSVFAQGGSYLRKGRAQFHLPT